MRAVDRTPLLDQIEDRLLLPRPAAGGPRRRPDGRPPACRSPAAAHASDARDVRQIKHPARPRVRPPVRHRPVDQPQQLELGLRAHARGDRAEKPERCLPRYSVSSTAISFSASDSRSFSARAASSSTCSGEGSRPGFADANAANAASFANARKRMITLTSTPYFLAASACEISCEVTSREDLPLLLRRQLPRACACRSPSSRPPGSGPRKPPRIRLKNRRHLYREVRRKPSSANGTSSTPTATRSRP